MNREEVCQSCDQSFIEAPLGLLCRLIVNPKMGNKPCRQKLLIMQQNKYADWCKHPDKSQRVKFALAEPVSKAPVREPPETKPPILRGFQTEGLPMNIKRRESPLSQQTPKGQTRAIDAAKTTRKEYLSSQKRGKLQIHTK